MNLEKFRLALPVYDTMADDEEAMADLRVYASTFAWKEAVTAHGGSVAGEPTLEEMPNLRYGWPLYDEDDQPILGDDGEPLTDAIKLYLVATGYAERPS